MENAFSLRIDDITTMVAALDKELGDTFVEIGALEQVRNQCDCYPLYIYVDWEIV